MLKQICCTEYGLEIIEDLAVHPLVVLLMTFARQQQEEGRHFERHESHISKA